MRIHHTIRIEYDASGVGRCWRTVDPDALPVHIRYEIMTAVLEGEAGGGYVATNGQRYRVVMPGETRREVLDPGNAFIHVSTTKGNAMRFPSIIQTPDGRTVHYFGSLADRDQAILLAGLDTLPYAGYNVTLTRDGHVFVFWKDGVT